MPAARYDITFEEGSDFTLEVKYEAIPCDETDVSGYGAEMEVRNGLDVGTSLIEASIDNGKITLPGETGVFHIRIPESEVNGLEGNLEDSAVWDMFIWPEKASPTKDPLKILKGKVKFDKAVTAK